MIENRDSLSAMIGDLAGKKAIQEQQSEIEGLKKGNAELCVKTEPNALFHSTRIMVVSKEPNVSCFWACICENAATDSSSIKKRSMVKIKKREPHELLPMRPALG